MRDGGAVPALSTEAALLVACARARLDPGTAARVRELAAQVRDWDTVLELARRHRLVPLVHTHLNGLADVSLPEAVRAALREEFSANAAKNLALSVELLAVIDLLTSKGIQALPYKGPTLAQCIYGSLAARQMKDLDILVRASDVNRVVSLLERREYDAITRVLPGARTLGLEYQSVLVRPSDETIIELHWSVVPRAMAPAVRVQDLWPHRLHTTLLGRPVATPAHEDMLVVLCIHGSKHRWARLEWISGVAELLRSKPLDWVRILQRAHEWHASRMLGAGLRLATELLGAPVADEVSSALRRDASVQTLAAMALERLFTDDDPAGERRALRAYQLRAQDRAGDRARYRWFRPLIDGARAGGRIADWLQR